MFSRIFHLFIDSFKFLYREKLNFYISSATIAICLIAISLIMTISISLIEKIKTIEEPSLIVTYEKLDKQCEDFYEDIPLTCAECDYYDSQNLEQLDKDSKIDRDGKADCKECIEEKLKMKEGDRFSRVDLLTDCNNKNGCVPHPESVYAPNFRYDEGEAFDDLNGNKKWDPEESFIDDEYYGSKKKTKYGACIYMEGLKVHNQILNISGISKGIEYRDKNSVLIDYSKKNEIDFLEADWIFEIVFDTYSKFSVAEEIDDSESLNNLINKIKALDFVKDIKNQSMLDIETFVAYKNLVKIIIAAVSIISVIIFLIPIFIVSNMVHLIIYSKREVLKVLRILGERDFYIKLPFIFQGIWQGIIGAFIAIIFIYILDTMSLGGSISHFLNTIITQSKIEMDKISLIYGFNHICVILLLGILLGVFGALRSISKYLK